MRLYIALDRSPLQFTQFCRRSVFTTSYNLGHTLSMHYLSGAIFGAGKFEYLHSTAGMELKMFCVKIRLLIYFFFLPVQVGW